MGRITGRGTPARDHGTAVFMPLPFLFTREYMTKKCGNCGAPAPDNNSRFCDLCGSPLKEEQVTPRDSRSALPAGPLSPIRKRSSAMCAAHRSQKRSARSAGPRLPPRTQSSAPGAARHLYRLFRVPGSQAPRLHNAAALLHLTGPAPVVVRSEEKPPAGTRRILQTNGTRGRTVTRRSMSRWHHPMSRRRNITRSPACCR